MKLSTEKAYQGDIERFLMWGGAVPAPEKMVASYLYEHSDSHKFATLARWRVSLGKAHSVQGLKDPTKTELVNAVLKGIKQEHGREQRRVAPLTSLEAKVLLNTMGGSLKDLRDKALIGVGFFGGLRRSEITNLTVENITRMARYGELTLSTGRVVVIPLDQVKDLDEWLATSGIETGAVFRSINRHGQISGKPLTGHGVARIIKERFASICMDPALYSVGSLRSGLLGRF
ncbi:MAG: hypothetical protein HQL95_00505 [Magnetococcales bacterium]|nr:hypothetical protein [Magnetococcales bacterium]